MSGFDSVTDLFDKAFRNWRRNAETNTATYEPVRYFEFQHALRISTAKFHTLRDHYYKGLKLFAGIEELWHT